MKKFLLLFILLLALDSHAADTSISALPATQTPLAGDALALYVRTNTTYTVRRVAVSNLISKPTPATEPPPMSSAASMFSSWNIISGILTNGDAVDPATNQIYGPSLCFVGDRVGLYYGSWTHPGFSPVTTNYGGIKAAFANTYSTLQNGKIGFVLQPSTNPAAWDSGYVESPRVRKIGGQYVMTYFGGTNRSFEGYYSALGLATSADGTNWTRSPSNPVVQIGNSNSFDGYQIFTGDITSVNGTNFIAYVCWGLPNDGVGRLGLAWSTNLHGPYVKYPGTNAQLDVYYGSSTPLLSPLTNSTVFLNGHPLPNSIGDPGDPTFIHLSDGTHAIVSGPRVLLSTNMFDWYPARVSGWYGTNGILPNYSLTMQGEANYEPAVPFVFNDNGPAMVFSRAADHATLWLARPEVPKAAGNFSFVAADSINLSGGTNYPTSEIIRAQASTNNLLLIDHFLTGGGDNPSGDLGWVGSGGGSGARYITLSEPTERIGVREIRTSATSGTSWAMIAGTGDNGDGVFPIGTKTNWQADFVFQLVSTNNVSHQIGFLRRLADQSAARVFSGVFLRYDSQADTNWVVCYRDAGNAQKTNYITTFRASINTNWNTASFYSVTPGEVIVKINNSVVATNAVYQGINMAIFANTLTLEAATKTSRWDMVSFRLPQ